MDLKIFLNAFLPFKEVSHPTCSSGMINFFLKSWFLNILETFFWIAMVFLSALMLHARNPADRMNNTFVTISTGSAFIAIVVFHFHVLVKDHTKAIKRISSHMKTRPPTVLF